MATPCTQCGNQFETSTEELAFLKRMAFRFGKITIELQPPTRCPACRLQIRTAHRNERFLYKRRCDLTQRDIVSIYHPEAASGEPYKVYAQDVWHTDQWDPLEYGRKVDLSKPIFPQWAALHKAVPRMSLVVEGNENSDFTTGTAYSRNCYLINSSENCEDCYYGKLLQKCRSCVDCSYAYDSELCYQCVNIYNCYGCTYTLFSKNCRTCHFSSSLTACTNCFLCMNLEHKEYCYRNEQLTREQYEAKMAELKEGSWKRTQQWVKEWQEMERGRIHRAANLVNCENCTGDYLENSKNCQHCFDMTDSEDCLHTYVGVSVKDNQHCSNMYLQNELCYELLGVIDVVHAAYCLFCFHSQDILFCEYCFNCKDCFGCNGLKHKQYCIFNVQYTKEEYEELVPKIIERMKETGEWGLFFPVQYSPFSYSETVANEFFPLSQKDATAAGFGWKTREDAVATSTKTIPATQLPDRLSDIPDDVLNWQILCERTNRPCKITKQELAYYRLCCLPLPRLHPDVRYDDRSAFRNKPTLWQRTCANCKKPIQTTFAPERPETVYCEECYLKTVY